MKNRNLKELRLHRSNIQQSVISICCMLLMVSSFAWLITSAITTKGVLLTEKTSVTSSDKGKKEQVDSVITDISADEISIIESSATESSEMDGIIDDEFEDAAFIGDSRTVGLQMNTNIPKASFYASIGMNISTATTDNLITLENGNKGTVLQGIKEKQYKRIYIMFGINELGWPYPDVFQEKYEGLINEIKKLQPDATVYVQSILPVSDKALSTNSVFTNENVNEFNQLIQSAATNTGATYLDVASVFKDENGKLPAEATTDGIHLLHDYCQIWLEYLADNT